MSTTKQMISDWFDLGVEQKATHMLVVCDTFDYEDYPVYVKPSEKVREEYAKYNGPNMQKVMEVYDLKKDRDTQLNEGRSFNF